LVVLLDDPRNCFRYDPLDRLWRLDQTKVTTLPRVVAEESGRLIRRCPLVTTPGRNCGSVVSRGLIPRSIIKSWRLIEQPRNLERAVPRLPWVEAHRITDPTLPSRLRGSWVVPLSTLEGVGSEFVLEVVGRFPTGWWSMHSPHL
jgi:hypothetical protein